MEKRGLKKKNPYLLVFIPLLVLLLVLAACQSNEPAVAEENNTIVEDTPVPPTLEPTPEPTPIPDQSEFYVSWESGSHNVYDLYHGPNTWCARCHSPQNWDPEAVPGTPPNCFSCKFPTDAEVRISDGNDLVLEEDWVGINCAQCHMIDENGTAQEIAWLNPISDEYVSVNTPTELCEKCHVTTTGNSFGSAVDHQITLGGSAHLNYGGFIGEVAPPQYCSDCHDPHTTEPMACSDCHEVAGSESHAAVTLMLDKVSCMACHDAAGYDVGPDPADPENGIWTTTLTEMGRSGPTTSAIVSHSIVYDVSCTRCHFEENPWGLIVLTEDGQIPEPEEEG